ncbi:DUF2499 domain-containing protein [Aerosakkonemataceae cyanobacterium BLCC-F50]|uniref:DUF2499 domain-containing protein n=1 Tax=Floridaenema flaviceps BLCC-F50 TaxID=3153642 RepID=A0ABV4XNE5_9CYAN
MHVLSIPTWIIHVSSVIEWIAAIWLIWTYGEVTKNRAWYALSMGMLPALVSAMCACTWHYFDNPKSLEWLVTLQAAMTVLGNFTLLLAGWLIWRSAKSAMVKTPGSQEQTPSSTKLGL